MKFIISIIILVVLVSCEKNTEDNSICNIEGRWHLTGFETTSMFIFDNSIRYTLSSNNGIFGDIEDAINSQPYLSYNNGLSIDLLANSSPLSLDFKCNCNVVDVYQDDTIWTWWKEGYTLEDCKD